MSNLKSSQEIQDEINNKRAAIEQEKLNGQQANHEHINQWENEISILEMQLADKKAEEAQQSERVQAQTEKVESITLPLDFNDLLDNPLANEMVIEVVKQFQLQAYDEHNTEVTRINAEWKSRFDEIGNDYEKDIDLFNKRISDLEAELESEKGARIMFENAASFEKDRADQLEHDLHMANLDKDQALMYRDNAVAQLGERQDVINSQAETIVGLQQELTAKKALTVNGNDKLAELASKAKESTIEKANRGLQRWGLPTLDIPSMPEAEPLTMPEIPAAQEAHTFPEGNQVSSEASETDTSGDRDEVVHESVAKAAEEATLTLDSLKAEIDALKTAHGARLDRLDKQANLPEVA